MMGKLTVCGFVSLLLVSGARQVSVAADDAPAPIQNSKSTVTPVNELDANDQAKAMVAAAEKAYAASIIPPFNSGLVDLEQVYTWSRRWLQAAVNIARTPGDRETAYRDHRDRMQRLRNSVQTMNTAGTRGGEENRLAAAQFYLAEASLWLAQQGSEAVPGFQKSVGAEDSSALQIEVYPINTADPETVLKVLQTALSHSPEVRLTVDTKSNSIVAQARASEQAKIRELVSKLDVRSRELVKPNVPIMQQSKPVAYEVRNPAELIKILQPLLAGQSRVEMKSLANNSQLIVSAGGATGGDPRTGRTRGPARNRRSQGLCHGATKANCR